MLQLTRQLSRRLACALFGLLASWSAAADVNLKELGEARWTHLESDNFIVVTDARGDTGRDMLAELERFRYFMFSQFGDLLSETDEKMPLVLIDNYDVYSALGLPEGYSGIFINSKKGSAVLADTRGFSRSTNGKPSWGRSVVLHELFHYLMHHSSLKAATTAPWVDEGLAEYFSTYVENQGRILLGDPDTAIKRIEFMLDIDSDSGVITEDMIASENLLKTQRKTLQVAASSSAEREQFLSAFYGRALAVVHFLSSDRERRQQFLEYLTSIAQGASVDDAFADAFGFSFAELDQQVAQYFQQGSMKPVSIPVRASMRDLRVKVDSDRLARRDAIEFLLPKISALPEAVLGKGNHKRLALQVRELYPELHRS